MLKLMTAIESLLLPDRYSIGLEITDHAVKIAQIDWKVKTVCHISGYGSEPLPIGVMDDGKMKEPYKIIQTIQTLLARTNIRSKKVHLVIPSQLIMVRFLKFPDIVQKDLAKLVDFELKHNIHLPFDNPVYDFVKLNGVDSEAAVKTVKQKLGKSLLTKLNSKQQTKRPEPAQDPLGLNEAASARDSGFDLSAVKLFGDDTNQASAEPEAVQCDVMLAAAPKELIEEYIQIVQSAGLVPVSIEFKALSLFRLIGKTEFADPNETFLLLDVNETSSDLSIFHDGALKITRSVPLVFAYKEAKQADAAELEFNLLFGNADLEFNNTCSDLAHEAERLMNFYRYTLNNRNQEFARVLLSGDAARLPEIAAYMRERLSMEVTVIEPSRLEARDGTFRTAIPALAVPIGLALRGRER